MNKNIFLSYCQKNSSEADIIDTEFLKRGIHLTRDKRDLEYKQNIEEFMQKIREHDFAILLISHEYLTSLNCMYEFFEVLKEKNFEDKILPIILVYNFYDNNCIIKYSKFWKNEVDRIEAEIKTLTNEKILFPLVNKVEELKKCKKIELEITGIISNLQKRKMIDFYEEKNNFNTIFKKIGIKDKKEDPESNTIILKKEIKPNYLKGHAATNEEIDNLFSENLKKESKLEMGMNIPKIDISFKSNNYINKEKNEDSNYEEEKRKILNGIVNNNVINYIEFLLKKEYFSKFIVRRGKNHIEKISDTILKLNNELQEKIMKSILNNYVEATGYNGWENYDLFGNLGKLIWYKSTDRNIKDLAYKLIKGCATHRSQFLNTLEKIDEERFL